MVRISVPITREGRGFTFRPDRQHLMLEVKALQFCKVFYINLLFFQIQFGNGQKYVDQTHVNWLVF